MGESTRLAGDGSVRVDGRCQPCAACAAPALVARMQHAVIQRKRNQLSALQAIEWRIRKTFYQYMYQHQGISIGIGGKPVNRHG